MSKFLRLVQENRPGEDKYTVELKDVNGELVDSFLMFGVGSPFENFDRFKQEFGTPIPIEDAEATIARGGEGEYKVDKEVSKLANQAKGGPMGAVAGLFGTAPQKAKKAVKKRQGLAANAVKIYDDQTEKLAAAIQGAAANKE